ncbi:Aldo/keto reductase [Lophium mytilinum]|uniref:Aldo/keto reductase n=1 Tax=Lophium mytilinum TaxID=390894 RepID=A0A6A6R680_9PEZI|nr:Aldo/keto reductase [Lophium mytilinum]
MAIHPSTTPTTPKSFTLNTGAAIPSIGFGTFANDGAQGSSYTATLHALESGYRHLDCAWFYQNETEVGDALHDFLAKTPSVQRADIFICTKVWNHLHAPADVEWSLKSSLAKLRVDYVDLFLVHWPIAAEKVQDGDSFMPRIGADGKYVINKPLTEDPAPTWRKMEELYDAGLARAIGVSNWTIKGLEQLLSYARVKPAVNQIEIHPFLPNGELVEWCLARNILPAAYSPLGSQDQVPNTGEKVRTNKELIETAEKQGATLAQCLLAWGLRRGYVVLPKSATPSRIESNLQVADLSDEGFEAIERVARGRRTRFVNMKDTFGYDVWPEESQTA